MSFPAESSSSKPRPKLPGQRASKGRPETKQVARLRPYSVDESGAQPAVRACAECMQRVLCRGLYMPMWVTPRSLCGSKSSEPHISQDLQILQEDRFREVLRTTSYTGCSAKEPPFACERWLSRMHFTSTRTAWASRLHQSDPIFIDCPGLGTTHLVEVGGALAKHRFGLTPTH